VRARARDWRTANPEKANAATTANQTETLERAERRGETWEPSEDKVVMDYSLTIKEIALRTARTVYAVNSRRSKLAAGERERAASIAAAASFIAAPRAALS